MKTVGCSSIVCIFFAVFVVSQNVPSGGELSEETRALAEKCAETLPRSADQYLANFRSGNAVAFEEELQASDFQQFYSCFMSGRNFTDANGNLNFGTLSNAVESVADDSTLAQQAIQQSQTLYNTLSSDPLVANIAASSLATQLALQSASATNPSAAVNIGLNLG
ncbi:hypothetical protein R5R35_005479 [Gryllus longicercus]|uniref:Uncharacterized protein n=1 Tax=Gryllus longicercus TaxID=2509291 RepID=A0AAN9ZE48_9ORTH